MLHYYFAKLQLHSLAVRGLKPPATGTELLSSERAEAANVAIYCAISAIRMFLDEQDLRSAMVGVPLFKHTMITFAAVFLLRVAWKWREHLLIDAHQVSKLVQSIIEVMRSVDVNRRHILWRLTNGLSDNLAKFRNALAHGADQRNQLQPLQAAPNYTYTENVASSSVSHSLAATQMPVHQSLMDAQARDIFDDLFAADGLSFAADEWLFAPSYDGFVSEQDVLWQDVL